MTDCPSSAYRGTSLIRNRPPLEPYSRTMPRALWWFLMSVVIFWMAAAPVSTGGVWGTAS